MYRDFLAALPENGRHVGSTRSSNGYGYTEIFTLTRHIVNMPHKQKRDRSKNDSAYALRLSRFTVSIFQS